MFGRNCVSYLLFLGVREQSELLESAVHVVDPLLQCLAPDAGLP